jgi:hypothetical protein
MGVDVDSFVGIGVRLNSVAMRTGKMTVDSCNHPEREGNKFCPTCGKLVTSREVDDSSRWELMDDFLQDLNDQGGLPDGFIYQRDNYSGRDGFNFLGWGNIVGKDNEPEVVDTSDLPDMDMVGKMGVLDTIKEILVDYPEAYEDCSVRFYHGFIYS